MTTLAVPRLEQRPWPTLGPQVCDFIESFLVHGPGDLRGQPARIDDEKRALIYRMYEVYPRGHEFAGRRRFKRCAISLRKGSAKTELAAWIAVCELHPDGPVRCDGFDAKGEPVGVGVTDPYIPLLAYTAEQSDELAYGALLAILENSELGSDFDLGLERVMRIGGDGKAVGLASAPSSRDGARTTFQVLDETHRWTLPRLKKAHQTMLANVPKRRTADAWSFETTTAPAPGEGSVAEDTMEYAQAIADGRIADARLFFFHRYASDDHDLSTREGVRAAVLEASGPIAEWSDIDGIVDQFEDPTADQSFLRRVWLNQLVQATSTAFDAVLWASLARKPVGRGRAARAYRPKSGALIAVGFDGSRYDDGSALVATEVETGFQWVLGAWERPLDSDGRALPDWEVPESEVTDTLAMAFEEFSVWRVYADPPYWQPTIDSWSQRFGEAAIVKWETYRPRKMADAIQAFLTAMKSKGEHLSHDGDERYSRHIGNAHRRLVAVRNDQGEQLWVLQKERKGSPKKIDTAMAGILSNQARLDAVNEGAEAPPPPVEQSYAVEWV